MSDRILVVDDDPQITALLARYLADQGFEPICVSSGLEMREVLDNSRVDLVVLDVGLPDADGFELTREIRTTSSLPIIVLSIRSDTFDRVFGLEFGADDYVTKPFEPRELVARIRSVLRRTRASAFEARKKAGGDKVLRFGSWIMNLSRRTVEHADDGTLADLTSMEFDLLRAFTEKPRVVLTRDQLLSNARGDTTVVGDRAIDVHIMRLRKKIERDPANPTLIKTIHGIGYTLAEDITRLN